MLVKYMGLEQHLQGRVHKVDVTWLGDPSVLTRPLVLQASEGCC